MPCAGLTRSRGFVAFAISARGNVGIDVEAVQPDPDRSLLVPFMLPSALQEDLDFHLQWTALEAFWKARGLGLSAEHPRIGLRSLADDELFEVVHGEGAQAAGFVVIRLPAPEGHMLSLACEEAGPVRMVQLEGLALAPSSDAFQALSRCSQGCDEAAAPTRNSRAGGPRPRDPGCNGASSSPPTPSGRGHGDPGRGPP